jgi:hypothetical protein
MPGNKCIGKQTWLVMSGNFGLHRKLDGSEEPGECSPVCEFRPGNEIFLSSRGSDCHWNPHNLAVNVASKILTPAWKRP